MSQSTVIFNYMAGIVHGVGLDRLVTACLLLWGSLTHLRPHPKLLLGLLSLWELPNSPKNTS